MKLPNFLIHTFAAVGVISLIFWGCAAADSDSIDTPPQLTGGTYQVATYVNGVNNAYGIVVLNTETGAMRTLIPRTIDGTVQWAEQTANLPEVIFGH